jgi:hypothetical protein
MAGPTTDLSTLSRQELHDYRLELRQALLEPGGEGVYSEESRQLYFSRIQQIKEILGDD